MGTLTAPHPLRRAWALITASQALWAVGDLVWSVADRAGYAADGSAIDLLYIAGYVLLAIGLGLMLRSGTQNRDLGDIVDVAIIALATGLVLWPFVFEPTIELGWSLANFAAIVYAAGDVLLLALLAALYFEAGRRTVSVSLIVASIVLIFAADLIYYIPEFAALGFVDEVSSMAWIGGYVLLGAAGLHGSARAGVISSSSVLDSPLRRLRFVGVAIVALPLAFVVDAFLGDGFCRRRLRRLRRRQRSGRGPRRAPHRPAAPGRRTCAPCRFVCAKPLRVGVPVRRPRYLDHHRRRDGAHQQRLPEARRLHR